jgi:hypothetical protein
VSYASNDIGSLRFLAANVIYQATGALLKPESGDEADRGILDDAALMMDVISSYHTERDQEYVREAQAIARDRQTAIKALRPGMELDPAVLESLRWRELKAMFRALCRGGTFVRQESPSAEWKPTP